jgi:hypothetical protein
MTQRVFRALDNPRLHILVHPAVRLINSREPHGPKMEAVFDKAVEKGVAIKVNGNRARLGINAEYVNYLKIRALDSLARCIEDDTSFGFPICRCQRRGEVEPGQLSARRARAAVARGAGAGPEEAPHHHAPGVGLFSGRRVTHRRAEDARGGSVGLGGRPRGDISGPREARHRLPFRRLCARVGAGLRGPLRRRRWNAGSGSHRQLREAATETRIARSDPHRRRPRCDQAQRDAASQGRLEPTAGRAAAVTGPSRRGRGIGVRDCDRCSNRVAGCARLSAGVRP